MIELARNPLKIVTGKAAFHPVDCARDKGELTSAIRDALGDTPGCIICWQIHRIIWGRWTQGGIVLSDGSDLDVSLVEEIRAFHQTAELHLTRAGDRLIGRTVRDGEGEEKDYVDSLAQFWGEREDGAPQGYVMLKDRNRKLTLVVPADDTAAKTYGLVTRNYTGVNETTAQAGYDDDRYLAIVPTREG